jgi:type V secretory pathway adhesin AidA
MTLEQHLEAAGISLNQDVSLIIQEVLDGDVWCRTGLITGRVQKKVPQADQGRKELQNYNPEHNLLVRWQKNGNWMLYILNRIGNGCVNWDDKAGGLIIESANKQMRICIRQTPQLENPTQNFWSTLKNRLLHRFV